MMTNILKRQLDSLPKRPGVYQFYNTANKLLYVGKAKNLRSRVRAYFGATTELSPAKKIMVNEIDHLVTTEVSNETEALLLERSLIKQHQPPYNIALKDDKSWLYLAIDHRQPYPNVQFVRRPKPVAHVKLFGPYVTGSYIKSLFPFFKKTLGLKTCSQPPDKPCFQASLGRCLGHNLGRGSKRIYAERLKRFEQLLSGRVKEVIDSLTQDMQRAAQARQFEKAAKLRDQLRALARLKERQIVAGSPRETFDVYGLARNTSSAAIARLPVRSGLLQASERFLLDHTKGLSDSEIIAGFLEQFAAEATDLPRQIYLPLRLKEKILLKLNSAKPKRGNKKKLLALATQAAQNHLEQSAASWQRREAKAQAGLKQLQELLKLPHLPKRIEGYDISNLQGQHAVGALVVFTDGLPDNKSYRKFKIQAPAKPNDVLMLAEVIRRRFSKNQAWPKPDLIMLDGGAGQLTTIMKVFKQENIAIPLLALAKKEELIYLPNKKTPLRLPADSPALLLLESLRDEAHRFGITYFRSRHRKQAIKSAWDELPGIGPKLKRKLKATFGSFKNLRQANMADLTVVLGKKKAEIIKDFIS
jgi:excinuclease ABC subunit C